jgi:hypothetical protein
LLFPLQGRERVLKTKEQRMNSIIWWVGLVVIVLFILGWLGLT